MKLIDKESLFNALAKQRAYEPKHRRTIMRSIQLVSEQPTVDAVPVVHGHWIHQNGYGDDLYYTCSACGCDWLCIEGTPEENNMRYCPECGAKMDNTIS